MPITPLHFGLIPVADKLTKGKMSQAAFVVTNVVLDSFVVLTLAQNSVNEQIGSGQRYELHAGADHTLLGALVIALLVALPLIRRKGWLLGCLIGAASHVMLDALVHSDLYPFWPVFSGNPIYLDLMAPLSAVLTIGCAVWALQLLDRAKAARRRRQTSRAAERQASTQ